MLNRSTDYGIENLPNSPTVKQEPFIDGSFERETCSPNGHTKQCSAAAAILLASGLSSTPNPYHNSRRESLDRLTRKRKFSRVGGRRLSDGNNPRAASLPSGMMAEIPKPATHQFPRGRDKCPRIQNSSPKEAPTPPFSNPRASPFSENDLPDRATSPHSWQNPSKPPFINASDNEESMGDEHQQPEFSQSEPQLNASIEGDDLDAQSEAPEATNEEPESGVSVTTMTYKDGRTRTVMKTGSKLGVEFAVRITIKNGCVVTWSRTAVAPS